MDSNLRLIDSDIKLDQNGFIWKSKQSTIVLLCHKKFLGLIYYCRVLPKYCERHAVVKVVWPCSPDFNLIIFSQTVFNTFVVAFEIINSQKFIYSPRQFLNCPGEGIYTCPGWEWGYSLFLQGLGSIPPPYEQTDKLKTLPSPELTAFCIK